MCLLYIILTNVAYHVHSYTPKSNIREIGRYRRRKYFKFALCQIIKHVSDSLTHSKNV